VSTPPGGQLGSLQFNDGSGGFAGNGLLTYDGASNFTLLVTTTTSPDDVQYYALIVNGRDNSFGTGLGSMESALPVLIDPGINNQGVASSTQVIVTGGGSIGGAADIQIGGCTGCNPSGLHFKFDYDGVYDPTTVAVFVDNQGSGNSPTSMRFRTFTFPNTMVENLTLLNTGFVGVMNTNPTEALDVTGNGKFSGTLSVLQSSVTASAFFGDGSHLSGIGSPAGSDNTWTGTNSYSTHTYQRAEWMGSSSVGITTAVVSGIIVPFVDGAVQSSGCVVAVWYDATRGYMVASSTSTDFTGLSGVMAGVLFQATSPGSLAKVITRGPVRVPSDGAADATEGITTSSTRCQSSNNAKGSAACLNNMCIGGYSTASSGGYSFGMMYGP
jgi:hypothetical protein